MVIKRCGRAMFISYPADHDVLVPALPREDILIKAEEDDLNEARTVPTSIVHDSVLNKEHGPAVDISHSGLPIVKRENTPNVQPCPTASSAFHSVTSVKREASDSVSSECLNV